MAGSSSSSGLFQAGDMFHFEPPDLRLSELDGILGDFSDLADIDFDDREDFQLTKAQQNERFGVPVSDADVDRAIAERFPEKTRRQTAWAVSVFQSWCVARGEQSDIVTMDAGTMQQKLCRFILEVRRQDGAPYPAKTLYSIVAGIQRFLRESGRHEIGFLNQADPTFGRLRQALDARMKELTSQGVGTVPKRAEPISKEQEELLWSKGVFDINSSQGLIYLVFFYNCKLFGLRGGDEHRQLCRDQFTVDNDAVGRYLRFMGRSSKNVKGGLRQKDVAVKDLKIYAQPQLGERCIVDVYNLYFGYIPLDGPFYRKPIGRDPPKFGSQCIGRNKLAGLMKEMCGKAGLKGNFTNHSGKVTCASRLFEHNVDEQLIMRQTGHRSNAVRLYKRPTVEHDLAVSRVLQPPSPKRAKVSCDYSKQNKSPLQAGIENQAPVPMSDAMDLQSPAAKKGVSMTFNFHF